MLSIALPLLILIGLITSVVIFTFTYTKRSFDVRNFSIKLSFFYFVLTIVVFLSYVNHPIHSLFRLFFGVDWFSSFGINLTLGVDAISSILLLINSLIFFIIILFSKEKKPSFYGFLFLIQTSIVGALCSLNLLVFYFFYELMLFPLYYLLLSNKDKEARTASVKFILYTLGSSLFMLLAILYCGLQYYNQNGVFSFYIMDLLSLNFDQTEERLLFLGFFVAFAVKAPIFPFHTWLPKVYSLSSSSLSTLMAGVLFQLGIYGIYRFAYFLFPQVALDFGFILAILATITIVYAALIAWVQKEVKLVLAYASISHIGFSVLGLSALTQGAIVGGIFQIFTHILIATGLFILAGIMFDRTGKREIDSFSGLASNAPIFSFFFLVFSLTAISVPLTASFVGEFIVLIESFKVQPIITSVAVLGVIIGAIYMLSLCKKVLFGTQENTFNDISKREALYLSPILLLILVFGVYPKPVLNMLESSISAQVQSTNGRTGSEQYVKPQGKREYDSSLRLINAKTKNRVQGEAF